MTDADPIRILQFITAFHIGGTERQFVALGRGLDPSRFDVRLACIHRQGAFLREIDGAGIPVSEYRLRGLWRPNAFRKLLVLASDLRRQAVDIVHTHGFYPNAFALPAAMLAGVPIRIASIRDTGEWWSAAQRRVQRIVCLLAHRILVNAQAVADRLEAEGYDRSRIDVIPNGIDLSRFESLPRDGELRRELDLPPSVPLVAVVARLNEVRGIDLKGIPNFLEAASLVAARFPEARFLVVGDGPCRPELERRAARIGLGARVLFTGFRLDIPRVLAEVTVTVLPSVAEALANSILEAMAAGVPVVATRVGGNPEAVEDGITGFTVPPASPAELARAICRILGDPVLSRSMGLAGRQRVVDRFSLDRMIAATAGVYVDLLREAGDRPRPRARWRPDRTPTPTPSSYPAASRGFSSRPPAA